MSPGSDPVSGFFKFAADKGFTGNRVQSISLGQGQGPLATKMIETACAEGTWVLLQNCHLMRSWMLNLEQIYQDVITTPQTHPDFRLAFFELCDLNRIDQIVLMFTLFVSYIDFG